MIKNIGIGKNLLETITSALYEDPIILFREYVQNSVDAYKRAINEEDKEKIKDFGVNINIDKDKRQIIIKDNGYGIYTSEYFEKKMLNFGISDKTDASQYIGFRGIGRVSAMPFCETLTFRNKASDSTSVDICTWEGKKYRELLNYDDVATFQDIVTNITDFSNEKTDRSDDHYFEVIIDNYGQEVDEVVNNVNFEEKLRKLLPLKYGDNFTASKKIIDKYNEFMAEDLNDFMYSIILNGVPLRKNYRDDKHVLESGIIFWELREKSGANEKPGKKIGILWFTFNRKIMASSDRDYGVLVRSKNILMGNNDTFADQTSNSKEYVATYRELTQTLRGIYGELLVNSLTLKDNARREWFKTDENSIYLKNIIIAFMKSLHKYRYCASKYYNDKALDNKKKLKEAFLELVDVKTNKINVNRFYDESSEKGAEENADKDEDSFKFADEDMPRQSRTKKKTYEELMNIVRDFFEKEKKYEIFLKLRAYIKKYYNE